MPFFDCMNNINMGDITPNVNIENSFKMSMSIRLDEYNFTNKIDLIKLDVQGWEKKALLGANNLIKTHKPIIIVEFEYFQLNKTNTTCKELFDFIREQNYYIYFLEYSYPSDHVCVHKDHLEDFKVTFKDYIFQHTENNNINNNLMYGVSEKIVL